MLAPRVPMRIALHAAMDGLFVLSLVPVLR
jgi:hypothetical protein